MGVEFLLNLSRIFASFSHTREERSTAISIKHGSRTGENATTSGTLTNYAPRWRIEDLSSNSPDKFERIEALDLDLSVWIARIINIWELYRWIFFLLDIFIFGSPWNSLEQSWIGIIRIISGIYCFSYFHQMYGYFCWRFHRHCSNIFCQIFMHFLINECIKRVYPIVSD